MSVIWTILAVLGSIIVAAVLAYVVGKFFAAGVLRTVKRDLVKPKPNETHEQK